MIVYAIKNKNDEYLNVNEWRDIDFYDEIYLASLFENKSNAEIFLKENFDKLVKYGNTYADSLYVKDYDCKVVTVEIKEIEEPTFHCTPEMLEAVKKSFESVPAIKEIPKIPKLYEHEDKGE